MKLAGKVVAQRLEPGAWGQFGWLPLRDTDPGDGDERLAFQWQDAHVNVICHRLDELQQTQDGLICEMMFRHFTHTQALLVLNCVAVMAVAPPSCPLTGPADLAQVQAFVLHPHDSLVLRQGTWHWGPFPVSEPQVDMFNVQGLRYAEDNTCASLAQLGAAFEVVTTEARH